MKMRVKMTGMLSLMLVGAALTGCGGGSGGGSGGGANGPGDGANLPRLSGLEDDADNHDTLYFTHGTTGADDRGSSILYALDVNAPDTSQAVNLTIEEVYNTQDLGAHAYVPLYEADIDPADGSVENYRVTDILFLHNREDGNQTSEGFARASLDGAADAAVRVSSESYLTAGLSGAYTLIWQNYTEADDAEVSYNLPGNKSHVRANFSGTDTPYYFSSNVIKQVAPVGHVGSSGDRRYIALTNDSGTQCAGGYFLTVASTLNAGGTSYGASNYLPDGKEAFAAEPLGGPLRDGSQYLVIKTLAPGDCASETALWRYDPSRPWASSLSQVLDDNGAPLIFPDSLGGGPLMPEPRHLAREGDVVYFGITSILQVGTQDLYRVEGDSWSLLSDDEDNLGAHTGFVITGAGRVAVSAGSTVVSWKADGSDRQVLDNTVADWLGALHTEVLGSRDGWIFYNRASISGQDNAVAMKIDGSDSLVIAGGQWVGASSSGKGEAIGNMTELSEVFLWHGRQIAAVSAADPKAGMVVLGELDAAPENVVMYGLAPGPHRLIQVHADEDTAVVYYVNTREANSLRRNSVPGAGYQRPVDGF